MKRIIALVLVCLLIGPAASALQRGDLGEAVLSLQKRLITLGYLEGTADGVYGDATAFAVSRFRANAAAAGHALDGAEDEATDSVIAALNMDSTPIAARPGDTSEAVLRVQRKLRTLGYLAEEADGYFGENTARAVRAFRRLEGLTDGDGVDETAWARLFSDAAHAPDYPALSKADKGKRVRALQTRLAQLGFFTGDIDGQYGAQTVEGVKALEAYLIARGEALDTRISGVADPYLQSKLYDEAFPLGGALAQSDEGAEVYRLQRRLYNLLYTDEPADGGFGDKTRAALAAFQSENKLKQTGVADEATLRALYAAEAVSAPRPYRMRIDLSEQKLYLYQRNKNGAYKKIVSTIPCCTGAAETPTPEGTYDAQTRPLNRWTEMDGGAYWVRFAYQVQPGLVICSIPHDAKNGAPDQTWRGKLGQPATDGQIYVSVENAKMLWTRCGRRTTVEIVP